MTWLKVQVSFHTFYNPGADIRRIITGISGSLQKLGLKSGGLLMFPKLSTPPRLHHK